MEKIQTYKTWFFIIGAVCLILAGLYLLKFHYGFSNKQEVWGTFGDYIGGVIGTILSFIAAIFLFINLREQRKLLELQNEEAFSIKFYELMKVHRDIVSNFVYRTDVKSSPGYTNKKTRIAHLTGKRGIYGIYKYLDDTFSHVRDFDNITREEKATLSYLVMLYGSGNLRQEITSRFAGHKVITASYIDSLFKNITTTLKEKDKPYKFRDHHEEVLPLINTVYLTLKLITTSQINNKQYYIQALNSEITIFELFIFLHYSKTILTDKNETEEKEYFKKYLQFEKIPTTINFLNNS
jgi:hypothetical protein